MTATLSLSAHNSVATLRPVSPLQVNTPYTVTVAPAIADPFGYQLGTAVLAHFTSLDTIAPLPPAAGAVVASIPINGVATVTATQGTAGAHDQVTIVNVTTGAVTPVLLDPNGGFTAAVGATSKDKLRLRMWTRPAMKRRSICRGSRRRIRTEVCPWRSIRRAATSTDLAEARSTPAGSLPDGSVVTINLVAEADFPVQLTDVQKDVFSFSGGLSIDFGGIRPAKYVNVSIPAGPNDTATDQWVVSQVAMVGGVERLNVVDTAHVIDGRIQTSSPPCPGVTGQGVYGIYKSKQALGVSYAQLNPGLMVEVDAYGQSSGTFADALFLPWAALVSGLSIQAPVCIPVLTGNVTINPNTVQVAVAGTDLTPADREIVITDVTKATELHFPRDVVEYAFAVQGQPTDRFDVTVTTAAGLEQPVNRLFFNVVEKSAGTVTITLDADKINVPIAKVTIKDLTVNPVRIDTFADSLVAMKFDVAGAAADQYEVRAIDVSGVSRTLSPVITGPAPPLDSGNLIAHAVTGTIDPTLAQILDHNAADPAHPIPLLGRSAVYLGDLESGGGVTPCGNAVCVQVPESDIINGGFTTAIPGNENHRWMITVVYDDGRRDTQTLPFFQMRIRNQLTGKVIRTIARQAPPRGQPSNLGALSGDESTPLMTGGPPRLSDFDPSSPLTVSFSQAMDPSTLTSSTFIVEKLQQNLSWLPIDGSVTVSADAMSATFVPTAGLAMGEDYRVRFSGAKSAGGKLLLYQPLFLNTFKPHRLCPPNSQCGTTFITPNDFPSASPTELKDVAYLRKTDPSGQQKTFLVAITSSNTDVKLMTFDVTDPGAPVLLGEEYGGARKQRITLIPNASISLRGPNGCGPAPHLSTFDGDLAVTTTFNTYYTFVSFYDLRDLTHPCLMSNKLLTATPDFLTSYSIPGTVHALGFGRGVATLTYPQGLVAYTAVGEVGLMSADAGKNIPEQLPAERKKEGMYPGDFQDVVAVGDQLLAIEKTSGDPPGALGLFDASLNRLMSFNLADAPRRFLYVPACPST